MKFTIRRTSYGSLPKEVTTTRPEVPEGEIELQTLEQLLEFLDNYGKLVIFPKYEDENFYDIEIYDTYRE